MKITSTLVFISIFLNLSIAQTSLAGYVTLQNSDRQSAFPAQVESFGATATDVASLDGAFELVFDRKKPGHDAYLEIVKTGYEVVNKTDLAVRLQESDKYQRPLKIYLCPKGQWQEYADQYYQVNLSEIYESYRQKLGFFKRKYDGVTLQNQEYQLALAQLDRDRKAAEALAQELAEKFAKANLDDATDRYVMAHNLFTKGEMDSVLILLDEEVIIADLIRVVDEIREGKELIRIGQDKLANGVDAKEKIVEEFMVKARAHIIKFDWRAAEKAYSRALTADSLNIDNMAEVADFFYELNQFDKAQPLAEQCLALAEHAIDSSRFLNRLADIHFAKNEFDIAESEYRKALKIIGTVAKGNNQAWQSYLADMLNKFGNVHYNRNELDKAEAEFQEALTIFVSLAESDPQPNLPSVALTLNSLAMIHHDKYELVKAEAEYGEALDIYWVLAETNPQKFWPVVSMVLNNLATLYHDNNELDKSGATYEEALKISRALAELNPQAYLPDVAMTLNNFAILLGDKNELDRSETKYEEALEIRRVLVEFNPQVYLSDVAITLNNLASLHIQKNDLIKAKKEYQEAIEIYRELAKINPDNFLPNFAMSLCNLANIHATENDFEKAKIEHREALEIRKALAEVNPKIYLHHVAESLYNLAFLHIVENDLVNADTTSKGALEIYKSLAEDNPNTFLPKVAETLNLLGKLYGEKNEYHKAVAYFEESLKIRRELAISNPMAYLLDAAITAVNLSIIYLLNIPDKEQSLSYAREALQYSLPFYKKVPSAEEVAFKCFHIVNSWGLDEEVFLKNLLDEMNIKE